jgi:hypothetical protein
MTALTALMRYLADLTARRRREPGDDLRGVLSDFVSGAPHGRPDTDPCLAGQIFLGQPGGPSMRGRLWS